MGMEVNEQVVHVLQHATAWPKNYRNYYVAGDGCPEWDALCAAVKNGLMTKRPNPLDEITESFVFHVTVKGKNLLKLAIDAARVEGDGDE